MAKTPAREYLKGQVLTAPKEALLMMMFDGALQFATQARAKLEERQFPEASSLLIRAQRIMVELVCSLNKEGLPGDLYGNLVSLYNFVYFRLVDGNLKKDIARVDEALRILSHLRETWALAIEQDRKQKFPEVELVQRVNAARKSVEFRG